MNSYNKNLLEEIFLTELVRAKREGLVQFLKPQQRSGFLGRLAQKSSRFQNTFWGALAARQGMEYVSPEPETPKVTGDKGKKGREHHYRAAHELAKVLGIGGDVRLDKAGEYGQHPTPESGNAGDIAHHISVGKATANGLDGTLTTYTRTKTGWIAKARPLEFGSGNKALIHSERTWTTDPETREARPSSSKRNPEQQQMFDENLGSSDPNNLKAGSKRKTVGELNHPIFDSDTLIVNHDDKEGLTVLPIKDVPKDTMLYIRRGIVGVKGNPNKRKERQFVLMTERNMKSLRKAGHTVEKNLHGYLTKTESPMTESYQWLKSHLIKRGIRFTY